MIVVRDVMHIQEGRLDEAVQLCRTLVQQVGGPQPFRILTSVAGLLSVLVIEGEFADMGAFEQYRAQNRSSGPFQDWLRGMAALTSTNHREFYHIV